MPRIPAATVAVIAAALDDYRLTTPLDRQTPHAAAVRAAEYLVSLGWSVQVPRDTPAPQVRVPCPHCGLTKPVTQQGRIRSHGARGNSCRGSGAAAPTVDLAQGASQ